MVVVGEGKMKIRDSNAKIPFAVERSCFFITKIQL